MDIDKEIDAQTAHEAHLKAALNAYNELPARVLAMCQKRKWSLHWTARGAYLHLEASELIEAIRGKHGNPVKEAADVLNVLMSITQSNGIAWSDVIRTLEEIVSELEENEERYPGEEYEGRRTLAEVTITDGTPECAHCDEELPPTSTIEVDGDVVIVHCEKCGNMTPFPIVCDQKATQYMYWCATCGKEAFPWEGPASQVIFGRSTGQFTHAGCGGALELRKRENGDGGSGIHAAATG